MPCLTFRQLPGTGTAGAADKTLKKREYFHTAVGISRGSGVKKTNGYLAHHFSQRSRGLRLVMPPPLPLWHLLNDYSGEGDQYNRNAPGLFGVTVTLPSDTRGLCNWVKFFGVQKSRSGVLVFSGPPGKTSCLMTLQGHRPAAVAPQSR